MSVYLLSVLIGAVTGLRTFAGPTAVSWAARMGWLDLQGTWLAFMGTAWTPWIFTALALFELVGDQLPSTPSRTIPMQFTARIVSAGFSAAAIGASHGSMSGAVLAGVAGAVVGTIGGHAARLRLAKYFGRDWPAAVIEDAVAYIAAAAGVFALR